MTVKENFISCIIAAKHLLTKSETISLFKEISFLLDAEASEIEKDLKVNGEKEKPKVTKINKVKNISSFTPVTSFLSGCKSISSCETRCEDECETRCEEKINGGTYYDPFASTIKISNYKCYADNCDVCCCDSTR